MMVTVSPSKQAKKTTKDEKLEMSTRAENHVNTRTHLRKTLNTQDNPQTTKNKQITTATETKNKHPPK